jgi:hypothetical protein
MFWLWTPREGIRLQAVQGEELQDAFGSGAVPNRDPNDCRLARTENRPIGVPREVQGRQKVSLLKTLQVEWPRLCLGLSTSSRPSRKHVLPHRLLGRQT